MEKKKKKESMANYCMAVCVWGTLQFIYRDRKKEIQDDTGGEDNRETRWIME